MLSRVQEFAGWYVKRDDEACRVGPEYPSGSKVRQYQAMAARWPGAPMIVGCSANSAMQIYVAAAAVQANVPAIVYTAKRQRRTAATEYALAMGAEVWGVTPAYLSVCRKRARDRAREIGRVVQWDSDGAIRDAAAQVGNLPPGVRRVIVPTGSGLTCAGVLAGLAEIDWPGRVLAVAVSGMASAEAIRLGACKVTKRALPGLDFLRHPLPYDVWEAAWLPDGSPLDPFYAAKALGYVQNGDCLWLPGLRPLSAMPEECRAVYQTHTLAK